METTKGAPEVPSSRKRKARQRNRRRSDQEDSDPAYVPSEEGGLSSTYNLNNVSTVCLSDERNKDVVFPSDNGETKLENKGMETTKEATEVPSLQKRKARKRRKRRNNQQGSDPAHKQSEEGGLPSTYNLDNMSTVCLSDERNREVVCLSDNGETKLENKGMETTKEAPEVTSLQKRKARKRRKRRNNQQDSDPAHKQSEEGGLPSTYNSNDVSTVCLSDERTREVVSLSDNGETKLENKGLETTKEAPELPSLPKRKARRRNRSRNNQQASDPAHTQDEEGGLPSTYDLNNVSTVGLSDERNRELVFLLGNDETKLVNKGMETTKEAPEVPSLQKRKARRRNRRSNNQQGGDPAHNQSEECGLLSTYNLNNVSTVCLSDERNREVVFLSHSGETKLENKGMETTKEAPEVHSLPKRKARRRNRSRNNQQASDPAHKQADEGGLPCPYNLNNVSTVCLSDERNRKVVFLSDKGEIKLANKGTETTKEDPEVPSLQKRKARRRNRRRNNPQDSDLAHKQAEEGSLPSTFNLNNASTVSLSDERNREAVLLSDSGETKLVSLAICDKENVPSETSSCLLVRTPICLLRKKLLILDLNGVLVDMVSSPLKGRKADIRIAKRAVFRRPFCFDFLKFCFERFQVGVWSSRTKKNVDRVIEFVMGDMKNKLLFCWDQSKCTATRFCTLEDKHKPMVFKELRRLWEKDDAELPWDRGDYSESNTLLLDDSPYKALLNPAHTAIFPYPYQFQNSKDNSLGAGGDLRVYLEELAAADNVQEFVEHHPFGQQAISERSANWSFYLKAIRSACPVKVTR